MLDKLEFEALVQRSNLSRRGAALVSKARKEAPVREVRSQGGNVVTILASRKMGCEIRTESRGHEFAAALVLEMDSSVLEFYPQPAKLDIEVTDPASGEIHRILHTPDFLSISDERIEFIECKSMASLQKLQQKQPWRYRQDSQGTWYAPLLESYFSELGLGYCLWTEQTHSPLLTENLLHLRDYFLPGTEPCPRETLQRIEDVLKEQGHAYVSELFKAPHNISIDHINHAIASKQLTTDFESQHLTNPDRCLLFRDSTVMAFMLASSHHKLPLQDRFDFDLREGATLLYEGQTLTIAFTGATELTLHGNDGKTQNVEKRWAWEVLAQGKAQLISNDAESTLCEVVNFSEPLLRSALNRRSQLESGQSNASDRTVARWKQRQTQAENQGSNPLVALVPRTQQRGNRNPKLTDEQRALMNQVIEEHWITNQAINSKACHRYLLVACSDQGIRPPSYPTLISAINTRTGDREIRTRVGKRMAYQQSTFVDVLYANSPRHGSRPLQYVHIDHTLLDIELLSSRTGEPLGRPWLTLAVDAYSRRVVSLYLSFDPPSYTSVMMCIRGLVQRHERLPEFIVVDNGKDLTSSAFGLFLQAMGVDLRLRPAGQPRHGAVLERLFGRLHSEYVHNLAGNTKATKNVRTITGKHLPKNLAEWTLESMYYGLQHWAFDYYDQEIHPALELSPRQAFQRGIAQTGRRAQRYIRYCQEFLIATCPLVDRKGTRTVDRQRGVKVNEQLYWHPEFASQALAGKSFPVRYDPWDALSVYVYVDNKRWLRAQCRNLLELGQLTETELQAMSAEYQRKYGHKAEHANRPQRLKEFLQTFTPAGALAVTLERTRENKQLYGPLNLANVSDIAPARKPGLRRHRNDTDSKPTPTKERNPSDGSAHNLLNNNAGDDNDFFETF